MAFYKKQKLGKKWYPRAVTGKSPFTTDEVGVAPKALRGGVGDEYGQEYVCRIGKSG